MAIYTYLGIALFGGRIRISNPLLNGTQYARAGYYPNNFNDFPSGMITLFEILVVNNWNVIMEGFVATSSQWAYLFFVSFYIIGVLIFLNLGIAFVLNASMYELDIRERRLLHRPSLPASQISLTKGLNLQSPTSRVTAVPVADIRVGT